MLILISPAKTLDYQSPLTTTRYTLPELLDNSQQLIHEARKLTPPQISTLMRISDKLAGINAARFHDWQPKALSKIDQMTWGSCPIFITQITRLVSTQIIAINGTKPCMSRATP